MPLAWLAQIMSGEEFGLHWADFRRQPWGPERDEMHAASIAHTVANFSGKVADSEIPLSTFLYFSAPAAHTASPVEKDPIEWMKTHGRKDPL